MSKSFMESSETLDLDFKKFWLILKRRWLPAAAVFSCVAAGATVLASLQQPEYAASGKLLFKKTNQTSLTGLNEQIGELDSLAGKSNPLSTEIEIIRSVPFLQKTITALDLKNEKGDPLKPQVLANKIALKNIPLTDVLQLSYESTDPEEAAAVVNKIMSLYIENNVTTNRAEAVAAGEFIAKQLPRTEATVRQAEVALRQFKEQNQVVALDEEAKSAVAVIKQLDGEITDAQAGLADANARSAMLQKQVGMNSREAIATSSLNESEGVQKVLAEFQQIEAELAVQQTRFVDTHPTIQALKDRREALKALLQERVKQSLGTETQVSNGSLQMGEIKQKLTEDFVKSEVERLGIANRLASLSNAQAAYKQRVNILPRLEQQQRELERRLEAAQSTYEILLKKLQEVRVAENQNMGNARIIEFALVPGNASNREKLLILAFGNLAGILLAIATIFILEVSDTSIKTLKQARELFGYTLLGSIPYFGKKVSHRRKNQELSIPELPVVNIPRSPISEAYRMLQANLKFLSSDKALKVIVVTSSVPKEGKSTVSANLAAAMAQLGRRVLLVDADMRHPLQHHIWELTNAAGLSDVIVGQAEFESTVKEVMPKLDVLSAGVIPPNPMALLDSKRMASLIDYFAEHYDFVIIDAPPLVLAADAVTLGKITDGVLLVTRPGVVDSTSAAAAKESLERSGQNVLGLVVNGVILENESDSYFYYAKGYSSEENFTSREKARYKTGKYVG
jgi:capsular exopolysaccharide synthesis family protein